MVGWLDVFKKPGSMSIKVSFCVAVITRLHWTAQDFDALPVLTRDHHQYTTVFMQQLVLRTKSLPPAAASS